MRPEFKPKDPAYEKRVLESFARQRAMESLGISISSLGPGWVELTLETRDAFTQQHGFVHAGVIATAMDSACGYAAFSLMPSDAAVLTTEYKINLLRPAQHAKYTVSGWVVKPGRTLNVCQARASADPEGEDVAMMTATVMTVEGRDIEG